MDREGGSNGSCYYSILGIRKGASFSEICCAYRKLALKWHPDRWGKNSKGAGEAKRQFQQIQEAYSVLSDQGKRSMYDAGFYDPFQEEEEGFSNFMQEMISMMDNVRPGEESLRIFKRCLWRWRQVEEVVMLVIRRRLHQQGREGIVCPGHEGTCPRELITCPYLYRIDLRASLTLIGKYILIW